jgi:hypothetical protein
LAKQREEKGERRERGEKGREKVRRMKTENVKKTLKLAVSFIELYLELDVWLPKINLGFEFMADKIER